MLERGEQPNNNERGWLAAAELSLEGRRKSVCSGGSGKKSGVQAHVSK